MWHLYQVPVLTYFDGRGLAELPRLLLAAGGVVYTDVRIPHVPGQPNAAWEKIKAEQPYGQIPVLAHRGLKIAQSNAIVRYIARQYHLEGEREDDIPLLDAAFEAVIDIRKKFFTEKADPTKLADYWAKTFPESVQQLAKNIQATATSSPFFTGKRISYVDIAIYYLLWVLATENKEAVDKAIKENPKIQALYEGVEKDEKIAAYLKQRKQTPW